MCFLSPKHFMFFSAKRKTCLLRCIINFSLWMVCLQFKMDTTFEQIILPGKASQHFPKKKPPVVHDELSPVNLGCDYAKEYVDKEEELYKVLITYFFDYSDRYLCMYCIRCSCSINFVDTSFLIDSH